MAVTCSCKNGVLQRKCLCICCKHLRHRDFTAQEGTDKTSYVAHFEFTYRMKLLRLIKNICHIFIEYL
jgi:hypothetical protein